MFVRIYIDIYTLVLQFIYTCEYIYEYVHIFEYLYVSVYPAKGHISRKKIFSKNLQEHILKSQYYGIWFFFRLAVRSLLRRVHVSDTVSKFSLF